MLDGFMREKDEEEAKDQMEKDLYVEYMESLGTSSQERMMKSLDQYQSLEEIESVRKAFEDIMSEARNRFKEAREERELSNAQISRQASAVLDRYSTNYSQDRWL